MITEGKAKTETVSNYLNWNGTSDLWFLTVGMQPSTSLGAWDTFQVIVKIRCSRLNRLQKETDNDFSSVQSLSRVWLFATPWTAAREASLSITNSRNPPKPMSIESMMPSNHLILCCPLLWLQSFQTSESFPMSLHFASGGKSIGVSASTSVPSNEHLGLISFKMDWISLQSKGLSRVFSNTTVQKHQFFGAQLSSQSNSHIHTWPLEKA